MRWNVVSVLVVAMGLGVGCSHQPAPKIPGHTDTAIEDISVEAKDGGELTVNKKKLIELLGVRPGNPIMPERRYNEFRLAEDEKRIVSFMHQFGRFDATVSEPVITRNADTVSIEWTVDEGPAYKISDLAIEGAPAETRSALEAMVPFGVGDELDLEVYRPLRRKLAGKLQDYGYGHARVYSRAFVDREDKTVEWRYYVDAGPRTVVGSIEIEGNRRVPEQLIRERLGFSRGQPFDTATARQAELALLDTGAFTSISIQTNADILRGPPEYPNSGGAIAAERITSDGQLAPRQLGESLDVTVKVVEAPSKQARLEAGIEGDPSRIDSYVGGRLWLRHFFGAQHHLSLDGHVGYGWLTSTDDDQPSGMHSHFRAQYLRPGLIGSRVDLRFTAAYREALFPTALLREGRVGPGVRSTLAKGVFFDLDLLYRLGRSYDFGPFDTMDLGGYDLSDDPTVRGGRLEASLITDQRNDGLEPTRGYFLAGRVAASPGGNLASHRYVSVSPEARGYLPISKSWSLAARGSAGWVLGTGDSGAPLETRYFGGGAYGMRGFGRQQLSPELCMGAMGGDCEKVGGLSLVESSLEARYLPFRELIGMSVFADVGGVGGQLDPFEDGVSAAFGVGARLRTWYVPISIDFATRAVDRSELADFASSDPYLLFVRIGEAF